MAGIDKTYIDGREYPLYRKWWIDNYDKMIKELGDYIWLYTFSVFYYDFKGRLIEDDIDVTPELLLNDTRDLREYENAYDFPIWNTSERVDKWLVKNCEIQSFRNRMLEVYPYNWKGFKGQKWILKPNKKAK
jgi:hypothetical protein